MTENKIQKYFVTNYLLARSFGKYKYIVPNTCYPCGHESDLIAVNRSDYTNEYEIKTKKSDFHMDFIKPKHKFMESKNIYPSFRDDDNFVGQPMLPNYFWFIIHGFEVDLKEDIPEYAGLFVIDEENKYIKKEKNAPLLHKDHISQEHLDILFQKLTYKYW